MIARLSLLAFSLVLAATPTFAKDKAAFACEGVFGPESSEKLLIDTYGADNVVTGEVDGPEGSTLLATTVFPNDAEKEMQFGWWNDEARTGLSYARLSPSMAGPEGVKIGMTVPEVEAINGKPFTIGGFWWDYGGYGIIDAGKLANVDDTSCYISLRFSPADDDTGDLDVSAVSGEVTIPSDEPLLDKLKVTVQSVEISYAGAEGDE